MTKRRQPLKLPVMVEGECDWCGGHIEGERKYCSTSCKVSYNNLQAKQGKTVVQAVKLLGVRPNGTSPSRADMLQTIIDRACEFNREDRERKARLMGGVTKEE